MADRPVQLSMVLRAFAADDPVSWQHLSDQALAAEEAGLDRLVLSDHVAMGEDLAAYGNPERGGVDGGTQPTGPDGYWLDPLITIAHLTAVTTRVEFGTNILLAALRRPVVLAKMAATIDALSGGRLSLGVGVGWQREEYEAAGLPFGRRGQLLDQAIEVCQLLWSEPAASYDGDGLSFDRIHQMPKPSNARGIPIWVSGTTNERAMRRLARFGTGWIPWGPDALDVETGIARMRRAVAAEGRDPADIGVVGTAPVVRDPDGRPDLRRTVEPIPALVAAGVTDVRLAVPIPLERSAATELLTELVARARARLQGVP